MKVRKFLCLILAMTFCFGLSNQAFAYGMGKVGMRNTVSCGYDHTAAIDENGSLWTWGDNWLGKLGTENGFKDSAIPVKVMDNVIAVSCGEGHTAAIKSDNSLWTWGSNSHGQLGNGTNEYSAVPVKVMDNVIAVSCGESHTAAVQTDGTLWTWGSNTEAQLGIGTYGDGASSDVPMKVMDNVAAISCGAAYTAAIQTDGSLWMWGGNDNGELGNGRTSRSKVPVKVLDNAVAVSCGFGHTAAIRNDGSLWMWGYNFHGQLGNGGAGNDTNNDDYTIQTVPVQVMDNVIAVSCLYGFTAAIQTDNSLWIWGDNSHGQFGNGTTTNSTVPIRVMDEVAAISCGYHHTAALKADNSLWTWGWNWDGQLGNGGGGMTALSLEMELYKQSQ